MARVTITSLAIANLGPYRERQCVQLSVAANRPVVLIKALNGSGKTTLLTCLQVGLYGARALHATRRSQLEQLILGLQRRDADGISQIEVGLDLEVAGATRAIEVVRRYSADGGTVTESVQVLVDGTEDVDLTAGWEDYIEEILPAELLQLFFFDGEKIESLANPERLPDLLRRATEVFLGIGGIDAVMSDLRAVERRTLLKNKNTGDPFELAKQQLSDLEDQGEKLRSSFDILTQDRASVRNALDHAHAALDKYVDQSRRKGLVSFEQAAELKAQLGTANERLRTERDGLAEALSDPFAPIAWLGKLWQRYEQEWRHEQALQLSADMLEQIKQHDQRVLGQLKSELNALQFDRLRMALKDDVSRVFPLGKRAGARFMAGADPSEVVAKVNLAMAGIKRRLGSIDEAKRALDRAEKRIQSLPSDDELSRLVGALSQHTKQVAEAEARLVAIDLAMSELQGSLAHAEMKINAARNRLNSEFRDRSLEAKGMQAGSRARDVLARFKEKLLASKAEWLSNMITTEFRRLMRKKRLITRVEVDPGTYAVSIKSGKAHDLPMDRLSAGERQLLAISILSALIKERKGRFPVVVDTPLARLDRDHRESVVRSFFASVSHQVLVLSTDEEVEGTTYDALVPSMAKEYALDFDDDAGCTRIRERQEPMLLRRVA